MDQNGHSSIIPPKSILKKKCLRKKIGKNFVALNVLHNTICKYYKCYVKIHFIAVIVGITWRNKPAEMDDDQFQDNGTIGLHWWTDPLGDYMNEKKKKEFKQK